MQTLVRFLSVQQLFRILTKIWTANFEASFRFFKSLDAFPKSSDSNYTAHRKTFTSLNHSVRLPNVWFLI